MTFPLLSPSDKYLTTKDYLVSGETFDLVYDRNRDLLFTSPTPPANELGKYYETPEYISHSDNDTGLLPKLYQFVKKWSIQRKLVLVQKQNFGLGSLLDVGAGTGDFLKEAKRKGWKVQGTEPNQQASFLAKKKGIPLKKSLEEFEGNQFDVVTLWHVLEHIHNLEETVEILGKLVKPNGSLIVAVPNFKSFDAKHYGKFWAAYDVPRHLWHFSKPAIQNIFSNSFKLEKTTPLYFDSFYVSLLSEKYKTGNPFSLKAFWIGFLSNWKAHSTKEFSSQIYCLRKPLRAFKEL